MKTKTEIKNKSIELLKKDIQRYKKLLDSNISIKGGALCIAYSGNTMVHLIRGFATIMLGRNPWKHEDFTLNREEVQTLLNTLIIDCEIKIQQLENTL